MTEQLIPVAFASVFVAGCMAIHSFQRWSEHVSEVLSFIFMFVVLLLMAEVMSSHAPHQYAAAPVMLTPSTDLPYRATRFNENGPTQMRAASQFLERRFDGQATTP